MTMEFYTSDEVARHNVAERGIWIIIHGVVYDLTKFIKEHPGGEEVLINTAGSDGSDCFDAIGHSSEALQLRELYKIGEIANHDSSERSRAEEESVIDETRPVTDRVNDDEQPWDYVEHEERTSPWFFVLTSLAVIIYAMIFYHFLNTN